MNKKRAVWTFIFLVTITPVAADSIGMTPADITFDNIRPGGYAEREVSIRTTNAEPITLAVTNTGNSTANGWVEFRPDPEQVRISADNLYNGVIVAQPPEDAELSSYNATKRLSVTQVPEEDGQTVASFSMSITQTTELNLQNQESQSCDVLNLDIQDTIEAGNNLTSSVRLHNTGNVETNHQLEYTMRAQQGQAVRSDEKIMNTLPTERKQSDYSLATTELPPGQYNTTLEIPSCDYTSSPVLVSVREPGSLRSEVTLLGVQAPNRLRNASEVTVKARLLNDGEKAVQAQFRGDVLKDGESVKSITSESTMIQADQTKTVEATYKPTTLGRKTIRGKIHYDNKVTYDKGTIVNVLSLNDRQGFLTTDKIVVLATLALAIALAITTRFLRSGSD